MYYIRWRLLLVLCVDTHLTTGPDVNKRKERKKNKQTVQRKRRKKKEEKSTDKMGILKNKRSRRIHCMCQIEITGYEKRPILVAFFCSKDFFLTGIDSEKTLAMDVCEEKESIKVKQINEEREEEEKPTMKQTNSHQGHFLTHQTCTRLSRFLFFFRFVFVLPSPFRWHHACFMNVNNCPTTIAR